MKLRGHIAQVDEHLYLLTLGHRRRDGIGRELRYGIDRDISLGDFIHQETFEPQAIGALVECLERPGKLQEQRLLALIQNRKNGGHRLDLARRLGRGVVIDLSHKGLPHDAIHGTLASKPEGPIGKLICSAVAVIEHHGDSFLIRRSNRRERIHRADRPPHPHRDF